MAKISEYLETIQPELAHTARLFGLADHLEEFRMEAEEGEGVFRIAFTDGEHTVRRAAAVPEDQDLRLRELHRKRAARRLCKQTLYDLCREKTGIHPPWGSLTGVRPTHLMLEALAEGLSREQAVARLRTEFDVTGEKAELLAQIALGRFVSPAVSAEMDALLRRQQIKHKIRGYLPKSIPCAHKTGEDNGITNDVGIVYSDKPFIVCWLTNQTDVPEAEKAIREMVYVGGGTPTALPEADFQRMTDRMMAIFPGAAEYTIEAGRPDTLTQGRLRTIREAGVRRISINPQTMNDRTLRLIGRAHTAQQVREAYALAREEGIPHINMDVIAGLPGEDAEDFARTMEEAERLRPESLTVHTLAIKRSSPWGEKWTAARLEKEGGLRKGAEGKGTEETEAGPTLPSGETAEEMVRQGRKTAERMGMRPYYLYKQKYMAGNLENTGYALPGHECLYNVDIMEETSHILALGAGGISKRIYPEEGHIGRAPNVSHIETYIGRLDEMIRRKRELFLDESEGKGAARSPEDARDGIQ